MRLKHYGDSSNGKEKQCRLYFLWILLRSVIVCSLIYVPELRIVRTPFIIIFLANIIKQQSTVFTYSIWNIFKTIRMILKHSCKYYIKNQILLLELKELKLWLLIIVVETLTHHQKLMNIKVIL